jgi:hypothetical protein
MKFFNRSAVVALASFSFLAGSAALLPAAGPTWGQEYPRQGYPSQEYPAPYTGGLRSLVNRTQDDLRRASEEQRQKGDQRDRYIHTQEHLSTFDRHLTKGKFDKDELDKVIDGVKSILDKNTLQATSRDLLLRDLDDLRAARERRY